MQRLVWMVIALATVLMASAAFADGKGQVVQSAEIYSKPGRYPIVGRLARGDAVKVAACNNDRTWCEIGTDKVRGWVLASTVEVISRGKAQPAH